MQTKPLTVEEQELAKGATLERNKALVAHVTSLQREQKEAVRGPHSAMSRRPEARRGFVLAQLPEYETAHAPYRPAPPPASARAQGEYIKAASLGKAAAALALVPEPIRCGKDVSHLPGIGESTVKKIDAFFAGGGGAPALASAADDENAWVESSDKDVVVGLVKAGSLSLDVVRRYRSDITADDLA